MSQVKHGDTLLREREPHGRHRVTYVELFFDLVFVFAITQISHTMLAHFTPLGVAQTTILFVAVWWVWIFTSWVTNWLDPERTPVRVMLFGMMIVGLLLSTSIPKAFETRGLAFALAFAGMQVGRSLFTALSIPKVGIRDAHELCADHLVDDRERRVLDRRRSREQRNAAGSLDDCRPVRICRTGDALPASRSRRDSSIQDWEVEGGHMAERCALFIIIALGEFIVVTGSTFAGIDWTTTADRRICRRVGRQHRDVVGVFSHRGRGWRGSDFTFKGPGRLARLAYTYLHLPIVAGIVVAAVGDELLLAHPDGHTDIKVMLSMIGGPLLFLIGSSLFKREYSRQFAALPPRRHRVADRSDPVRALPVAAGAVVGDDCHHAGRGGVGSNFARGYRPSDREL